MNIDVTTMKRVAALAALLGIASLQACSGGGSHVLPSTSAGTSSNSNSGSNTMLQGKVTAIVPAATVPQTGTKKKPNYLNSSDPNSALVVSVAPTDPAEAAQWQSLYGTSGFSLCFNLYTNGTVNAALNPQPVAGGGVSVSFPMPAPPGNDTFTFFQYDGQCSTTNAYTPPTPSPTANGNGILAEAPSLTVNFTPGAANNFNVALTSCGAPSTTGGPCTNATPAPGTPPTTVQMAASVAAVYIGAPGSPAPTLAAPVKLPIPQPIREQHAFLTATDKIGVPIPVVGVDSSGFVIAGSPATGSGTLPKAGDNITLAHTETGPSGTVTGHALLYLVDATTGAVAQTEVAGTTPIKLTQLNALDAADAVGGGVVGDPYVVVLTFDGSAATQVTSVTVTLNATINGKAVAAQTVVVKPQSTMFSVGTATNGYADAGGPYAKAADILNTTSASALAAAQQGYWITDGGAIAQAGVGRTTVTGATTLTAMTLDTNASFTAIKPQILAVDNSTAAASAQSAPLAGGVYVFSPTAATSKPLAIQDVTTGNYMAIGKPQGIAYVSGGFVYVLSGTTLYAVDPESDGAGGIDPAGGGAFYQAEAVGAMTITGLSNSGITGLDIVASGTKLYIADPGNKRVAVIDTAVCALGTVASPAACAPSAFASGDAFVGLAANGTGYLATDTSGQIYTISSSGTVASLGLTTGGVQDGPVGILGSSPLAPSPYPVQGNAANFFSTAPTPTLPYSLAPFSATGPIFAPAAQTAVTGAPLLLANQTELAVMNATAVGKTKATFGIASVPAANATNAALSADSYLFTDSGNVRTLIP